MFLPTNIMYQLYCTLVLPYLNYGLLVWGNGNKDLLNKVFRLQKRALRVISNSAYLCPTKPLFDKFKTLNIYDMYLKETAIFMFKYKHGLLPSSFKDFFTTHCQSNTRNKSDFQIPIIYRVKTIFSTGQKIWNGLPNNVKNAKTLGQFKRSIKLMLSEKP